MTADPTLTAPAPETSAHRCLPLYRAEDGQQARCWCGRDCRADPLLRPNNVVNIAFARAVRDFRR